MGNKQTRHRSYSDGVDGNTSRNPGSGQQRGRRKPTRSQSTSQVDGRNTRVSMPDLGGAVPYQGDEDPVVDVKLYHSYGNLTRPKSGALGEAEPDIKYYRKSTDGASRFLSLPRHFGRSKSAAAADVPNGTVSDYPELKRRRELPYDPGYPPLLPPRKRSPQGSESGKESQRTSKRVSAASSLSSLGNKAPVNMEDFPTTAQIKRKIKCFEDQFCRSLVDKYAGLADTLQLSALAIALARGDDGIFRQVALLDYLDTETIPIDLLAENQDDCVLLIPEALFHGLMHVRRDKISDLELWTNLARDLVTYVGVEAANEISQMYEYQIVLLTGDSAVRVLADHAAACVIDHIKRTNSFLDRNTATLGVVKGTPSGSVSGAPKYLSVILGSRELKWDVHDVLKCPGLRKDVVLFSDNIENPDSLLGPWQYFTSKETKAQKYGYRGLLLEWDWINKMYTVNAEDEASFTEDVSDPMDYPEDFHRMYYPYKRLFGTDFMIKYCDLKMANEVTTSLAQYLNETAGDVTARDHIHPVYRPLRPPPERINYSTCNFDNVDLTRAQLKRADLSKASVRNSKLLMTDMEGAIFNAKDGSTSAQMRGADVSYTTLVENTMDQQTLDGITAKHVVVMRPKGKRRVKKKSDSEVPNGHDSGATPADAMDVTPVTTAKAKKKKKRVPKTLDLDSGGLNGVGDGETAAADDGDVVDGDAVVNGGERSPDPRDSQGRYGDEVDGCRVTSFISDSQGNLLDIEQATGGSTETAVPKKIKKKVKKNKTCSEENIADPEMIEQKQQKIREKKKKVKKRPVQPISTTPTEPIPETPVFVEEQVHQQRAPQQHAAQQQHQYIPGDQTRQFFTESQELKQAIQPRTHTVVRTKLQDEPASWTNSAGSGTHRQGSDGSQQSATDYNILDGPDSNGRDHVVVELVEPGEPPQVTVTKSKSKKSKGKTGEKTKGKSGEKKRKKSSKSSLAAAAAEDAILLQPDVEPPRPHSVTGTIPVCTVESFDDDDPPRPASAIPDTAYIDADPALVLKSPGKALSTTNIHQQHSHRAAPHGGASGGLYPRMTKSLSHHGNLGVGARMHNLSMDSQGMGLRTARQIYGLSKEEIEFITRSQIFNMIKGLQIENIESNLPDDNGLFIGRERECEDVTEMLSSAGHIVTITGCYGNGKSVLAMAVAREIQKKFVVPVIVDARGCSTAASIAHCMVRTFGLHFKFKELSLFYNWLNCHEQRMLIIVDNLDIPSCEDNKVSDLIDDFMANVKDSRMLCTSRRNFYKGSQTHEVYRLGSLGSYSVHLLNTLIPDLHDEGFASLCEVCADNPLALSLVSQTFLMDDIDSGKLFEELAQSKTHDLLDRIELALFDITEDDAEMDVLRKLTSCMLRLLDNIPLGHAELLVCASHFAVSFDAKTLAVLAERRDIKDVTKALDELSQTGLVLKNGDCYMLPSLVKFVNQSKLSSDGSATLEYYKNTIEDLKLVCAQYHSKKCADAMNRLDENYDNYIEVLTGIVEREDVYELCPSFASLEYGLFLCENLPDELYQDLYESFAQEAEDNDDVAKQCRSLCCLAHKMVQEEQLSTAGEAMEQVRALMQDRPSEISDTERAFYYRCMGKIAWEEKEDRAHAINLVKKALDLYKLSQGSRDLQTIFTNELYAWMLTRKDSYQTARHFYNISDLFIKEMMDEHPLLVDGYDCRRTIWDQICLFQRATDTAKKAVEVSKKFYGEHPITAKMMTNLCESIIKRGSLNDAISVGIDALSIRSKVLGDHVDTGQSYKTLAYLMLRSGQYDEASRFGQSALEVFEKVDAPEQFKTDVKTIISQARYRLEYKSHVYVELQGREANNKANLANGHHSHDELLDVGKTSKSVTTIV